MIDETRDPGRLSWVESANGHAAFPIQNLPFGVFSPAGRSARGGVAIGDHILDLGAALEAGLFTATARDAAELAAGRDLNACLGAGRSAHLALRRAISAVLAAGAPASVLATGCCTALVTAGCVCRPETGISPIFTPASTMPRRPVASTGRTIR